MQLKSVAMTFTMAVLSGTLSACVNAHASDASDTPTCKSFESWVSEGKVNILEFATGASTPPVRFRLKYNSFESTPPDGFFGAITKGTMTFSYPRQNNPEVPYVKDAPFPANFTQGPAFGDKVAFQAREIGCNIYELHWKEPSKGDTVTHVEDFGRQQVCTNITNLNRTPIPAEFDQFDTNNNLDNKTLFPNGSPVESKDFGFLNMCGTMSQSLESDKVWEDELNHLVYEEP